MRHQPKAHGPAPLPRTVAEMIERLNERYPEPVIKPGTPIEDIMFAAGQRSVVTQLALELANHRKKDLTPDVPH